MPDSPAGVIYLPLTAKTAFHRAQVLDADGDAIKDLGIVTETGRAAIRQFLRTCWLSLHVTFIAEHDRAIEVMLAQLKNAVEP